MILIDLATLDVETASKLLGRFAVKQAAALQIKQAEGESGVTNYAAPMAGNAARYAGAGALGGAGLAALLTAMQRKKNKSWLANMLFGAAGGAGIGGAVGAFTGMPGPKSLAERAGKPDAVTGLGENYTLTDLEKLMQTGTPEQKAAAKPLLERAGYSAVDEPGALSEGGANATKSLVRGGLLGAGAGAAAGAAYPLGNKLYNKLPMSVSNERVTEAIKANPQIAGWVDEAKHVPLLQRTLAATKANIASQDEKAGKFIKEVQEQNAALKAQGLPDVPFDDKEFLRVFKSHPDYAKQVARVPRLDQRLLSASQAAKQNLAAVQAGKIEPQRGTGLRSILPTKNFVLRDSVGKDITSAIGGQSRLNTLVGQTRKQLLNTPRPAGAPGMGLGKRTLGGGLGGAFIGGITDLVLSNAMRPGS